VSETGKASRIITVNMDITLDGDTETSIYHREGTPGNYHYVKVRDAELTDADKTQYATDGIFTAMATGPVKDLQNVFVWVDHHGEGPLTGGASRTAPAGFAAGTTEGYSEYRLFVKKNQQIGKINLMFIGKQLDEDGEENDLRDCMSIELYGAGPKGASTGTQGREQKITRNANFSTVIVDENGIGTTTPHILNNVAASNGLLSFSTRYAKNQWDKYKALVLGKNITIDAEASAGVNEFPANVTTDNPWSDLGVSSLVHVTNNSLLIMNDHSKITGFYSTSTNQVPIRTQESVTNYFYMRGGTITGNIVASGVIKAHPNTNVVNTGGVIDGNTNKTGSKKNGIYR
jgi:hypothetical protein